jgi:predicted helicase
MLLDDYVKFIRFAQWIIDKTGQGIVAMITNHGYLDNPTFRGMRQQILKAFDEVYILDLHGNSNKKETAPDGSKDENVFDIQQGVAICIMVKKDQGTQLGSLRQADLFGLREYKYTWLMTHSSQSSTVDWQNITPRSPFYLYIPQTIDLLNEYQTYWKITDIMQVSSTGIKTHRDQFALDASEDNLRKRIEEFRDLSIDDHSLRTKYELPDTRDWKLSSRRRSLAKVKNWQKNFTKCHYRPLDFKHIYYHADVIELPRPEVMQHMISGKNLGIITTRQTKEQWDALATQLVCDHKSCAAYDTNSLFPLYLYTSWDTTAGTLFETREVSREANISGRFVADLATKLGVKFDQDGSGDLQTTVGPEDIFHYIYAIFHSPTYRERYAEFLKIDYPCLPLTSNVELFRALCGLGADLVALHLLEDDYEAASWMKAGESSPLESPITTFVEGANGTIMGTFSKSKVYDNGRVYLDTSLGEASSYFDGVPEDVWNFHIGGYQVLYKWLYDRRGKSGVPGRTLTAEDLAHYQRVVVSLKETMRLMDEVDEVIEVHGGWPVE